MTDDPNQPHAFVRRRDAVLGEWCVTCGRGSWHPLHGEPAPTRRRQHDPSLLMEEPDLYPKVHDPGDERRADDAHMAAGEAWMEHDAEQPEGSDR